MFSFISERVVAKNIYTNRVIIFVVVALCTIVVAIFAAPQFTEAAPQSWMNGDPLIDDHISERPNDPNAPTIPCKYNTYTYDNVSNTLCVTQGDGVRFSYSSRAVSVGSDTKFYSVSGLSNVPSQGLIPNTKKYIEWWPYPDWSNPNPIPLRIVNNFTSRLQQRLTAPVSYAFDNTPDFTFTHSGGVGWQVGRNFGFSNNGKWMVIEIPGTGVARMNLETFKIKRFSSENMGYNYFYKPDVKFAISDDGAKVFMGHNHGYLKAFEISSECGDEIEQEYVGSSTEINKPCQEKDITQYISSKLGQDYAKITDLEFKDDNGQELVVYTRLGQDGGAEKVMTLHPSGHTQLKLDYLALGDSYSSGEGDTERNPANNKQKYYRGWTDLEENSAHNQPREKCHISSRSYPYILAKGMHLSRKDPAKWETIACSGAQTKDVEDKNSSDYKGQGGRLKKFDHESLKSIALNEFIPGRQEQIEFVKKYKPKVITLTMGGNDIGFGDKIEACVWIETCRIATEAGKPGLAKVIKSQYSSLKNLYEDLYKASDNKSKIYVLGYPQFINGAEASSCGLNIGALDSAEREMIHYSVKYMNNVTKQATKAAGVKYIDIENSLVGGRLCDNGQKYVTGVTNITGWNGNERQESFHPNANGHFEMAMAIWDEVNNESLLDYAICPNAQKLCPDTSATKDTINIPPYFQVDEPAQVIEYKKVTDDSVTRSTNASVFLEPFSFEPNSTINVILHSDPIDLGAVEVDSEGVLDANIAIPASTPVGYHTLILNGKTYSGEPIQYEQIILVKGENANDIDDNGILDIQQPCGPFLQAANTDSDLDGIDDACDPEINEVPELYRLRQGDVSRDYNGNPEHENYLYIERNTHADNITGVFGDHDPDSDGWAVVGVSKGLGYTGSAAPDTAPAANFLVMGEGVNAKPYVYIRAGGFGCTSFTPASLAKVRQDRSRTIKKVAYNTDKCRQEASSDDVDGDSLPDNEQPLYLARNGDEAKNEDPSRIYLFRSFHASEAQLGISDYTPTGTPAGSPSQPIQEWNLLASSKNGEYIPQFNKLVTIEDDQAKPLPIILTKKQNGQCIAYKPENTNIIKRDTQKKLVKLNNIPEGVSCE